MGDEMEEEFEKSEELVQAEEKIGELLKTQNRTPEQETELKELRKKRQGEYQKRLNELSSERKFERDRAERLQKRLDELESKVNERENPIRKPATSKQTVNIGGEEFYTDSSLTAMIQSGEMTQDEAWGHQQERIAAMAAERIAKKTNQQTSETVYQQTQQEILSEYPHFHPNHPKHNPEDPLYKEANRLLTFIDPSNPRRLKIALDEAKRNLKVSNARPDISDELGVTRSSGQSESSRSQKKVELEDWEKDNAVRIYVQSGLVNPKTGKRYTDSEAYEKALTAKTNRAAQFAERK